MAKEKDQRSCPQQERQDERKKESYPASAAAVLSRHPALDGIATVGVSIEETDFLPDATCYGQKKSAGKELDPLRMG